MMMSSKIIIIKIMILLAIIAFLFPKNAGIDKHSNYFIPPSGHSIINTQCSCFGYEFDVYQQTEGPRFFYCIGIPYSCHCINITEYQQTIVVNEYGTLANNATSQAIPCE